MLITRLRAKAQGDVSSGEDGMADLFCNDGKNIHTQIKYII